jgi:hypothetical protein
MTQHEPAHVGTIAWTDLTVERADIVRDFYREVVGWTVSDVDMGGYLDYCMNRPDDGRAAAGICWKRGTNADLPAQWLVYITVASIQDSSARCTELGGRIIAGPKHTPGYGTFCVIQDPWGAVAALFEPESLRLCATLR